MKLIKKIKWSDVLIVCIAVGTFFFIREVFRVFRETGMEPSTMVAGYFSLVTAELAILWQMHNARKKRERQEKLDEMQHDDLEWLEEEAKG